MANAPVKLNIGAGGVEIAGFTPIDRALGSEAYPLDYADGSVDEIRASHILEHFPFADAPKVLADWVRVLRPGGRIRVAVPNLAWLGEHIDDPKAPFYMMGGQTDGNDFHKSAYTEASLRQRMEDAGLHSIQPWVSANTDCASLPVSLNLEGVKGESTNRLTMGSQKVKTSLCAVMSIPRLGWNDNWGCILDALASKKIPIRRETCPFWGHSMERLFEDCLDSGVDWILTLDYDSMFTEQHLDLLLRTFLNHTEADAMCALQTQRHSTHALLSIAGQNEYKPDGKPFEVTSAHFGLTLLRAEAIKKCAKPWFHSKPDRDGGWRAGKVDPDVWFWHNWRRAGHTVYVAPKVNIGHLELMVTCFDDKMKYQAAPVVEYRQRFDSSVRAGTGKRRVAG